MSSAEVQQLRLRVQSRVREWPLAIAALVASVSLFAVIAKVVPYMPDPGHQLALTITKLSNDGRKAAVPIRRANVNVLPAKSAKTQLFDPPPHAVQTPFVEQPAPIVEGTAPVFFIRPPPLQS